MAYQDAPAAGGMMQAPPAGPAAPAMPGPPMGMQAPPIQLHDVVVIRSKDASQARVEPVPPEEFGISRNARSLRDCDYAFHKVLLSQAKLIAQGFDKAQIKTLPTYTTISNTEELERNTVNESQYTGDEMNEAARRIEVTEHYIRMDYERNGKPACLYKVTTGGSQGDILKKDGKPDLEEVDAIPFAAMTPVIQTHRFFGRSIADLVMDIQRIKTALLRAMLDNAYLSNNLRVEVPEGACGPDTIDDLLVSRPGGIIRTKQPGMLQWQQIPSIGAQTFPLMEYMDGMREFRTGVTRQGQGVDADALQNQSATAVNQVFTAAQARIKLIARIFAETGIRDLFALLHATIRKHGQSAQTVQLRGQWVPIDPREWKKRDHMTIHVGLGTGTKQQQLGMAQLIVGAQKEAIGAGLVSKRNLYNSATHITKLAGHQNADDFFTDPSKPPDPQDPSAQPIPPPPDPKAAAAQQQAQLEQQKATHQAAIDQQQMQNDLVHQKSKNEAEAALEERKFQLDAQLKQIDAQLKIQTAEREHQYKLAELSMKQQQAANKPAKAAIEVKHGAEQIVGPISEVVAQLGNHLAAHTHAQTQAIVGALQQAHGPKRIVRGADGKVSHVEPMGN